MLKLVCLFMLPVLQMSALGVGNYKERRHARKVISGEGEAVTEYVESPIPSRPKPRLANTIADAALRGHCHCRNEREDRP